MSIETNSANEIQANWIELKFKLIVIDLTLFVNRDQIFNDRNFLLIVYIWTTQF